MKVTPIEDTPGPMTVIPALGSTTVTPEHVIQLCSMQGEGEYKLVALSDCGRMFERVADSRQFNDGRSPRKYVWKEFEGPFPPSA